MCKRITHLVIEHINHHQRQEAENKSQKYDEHHYCQSEIVLVSEELQFIFRAWGCVEFVQLCMLLSNGVENAGVRKNDDEAG